MNKTLQMTALGLLLVGLVGCDAAEQSAQKLAEKAEQAVQATIDALPAGGTRLIIAHRLSTICKADQIAVLDHGQVTELGTHGELLAKNRLYASLWRKQTGEDSGRGSPVVT